MAPGHFAHGGIPTELRNAVKVIVPFLSDSASSERAASFWKSFERCTEGREDSLRLTAFEQCLKGKTGQDSCRTKERETADAGAGSGSKAVT
jgi:hypothetical protein